MRHLPRNPKFWLGAFLLWFVTLWLFSSFSGVSDYSPPIDHIDKVQHFGYFFGGSGLLCAYLYRRNPVRPNWKFIGVCAVLVLGLVGCADEFHQSFTPGRSGNDPYDLMADVLGAVVGVFTFKRIHYLLK